MSSWPNAALPSLPQTQLVPFGEPTLGEWLKLNLRIGALSFGGSARHFLFHDFVVRERGWMKEDEFHQAMSLVQVLPGPNLINLCAYLGHRLLGARGAVLGLIAVALPGALMGILLLSILDLSQPHWTILFRGFSLGSLSLFALFIVKMVPGLKARIDGETLSDLKINLRYGLALAICGLALLDFPMIPVIFGGVVIGSLVERGF